ncbi:MAG: glycosyltransferase [Crocinitomicaceae bacterium]|nr:glycosyltransferase [Crocinitomicaceae bacterium]
MKVLILADINSSHTKKWVEGICTSGIEVGVFSLRTPTNDWVNQYDNLTIFPMKPESGILGKLGYLSQIKTVKEIVATFQPDIVHAHYATSYGLLGVKSNAKRLFISVWGSDVLEFPKKTFLHKRILKYILSKADQLFSTSRILTEETKKYTDKSIEIIPFGIDIDQFRTLPKANNEKFIIGTIKKLEHTYGIDRLIEVVVRLKPKYPQIECHIYGYGDLQQQYEEMIQKNNATDYIQLKGYIPHNEVVNALNEISIFCNLSRRESFGVAVLEALACETPVVVTKVGGLVEVVDDKKNGFICEESIDAIASKVEQLIIDDQLRIAMGKNGREWVVKQYNWKENLAKMLSFYH